MTSDKIIQIAEFAMEYFTGFPSIFGMDEYEQQEFLDQYYNTYGVGQEEREWVDEWFDDQPKFYDEEYVEENKDIG